MKFKDFIENPQELIGKTVLYESGVSYGYKKLQLIKIEKVTKTGFKLFSMGNEIFNLNDGCQKGLTGRSSMSTVSRCTLVTEEEAEEYRKQWKQKREEKELREKMKIKFETMSFEQLKAMELL
jgi:hypothetical protein